MKYEHRYLPYNMGQLANAALIGKPRKYQNDRRDTQRRNY